MTTGMVFVLLVYYNGSLCRIPEYLYQV